MPHNPTPPLDIDTVEYPDSDGLPMSDSTQQFDWIGLIKWNADIQFRNEPNVFVAGDHLIYPVRGNNRIRTGPDAYVAFGPPKGHRGSYKVWLENNVFPQVIFEVWSISNRPRAMKKKFDFYEQYGAEEYYIVHPFAPVRWDGWRRDGERLVKIPEMNGHVSPRLGWTFLSHDGDVGILGPDGRAFGTPVALGGWLAEAEDRARRARAAAVRASAETDQAKAEAEQAKVEADCAKADADRAKAEAAALRAKLRAAGIDPDA